MNHIPAVAEERLRQTVSGVLNLIEKDPDWLVRQMKERSQVSHMLTRFARGSSEDTDEAFARKLRIYEEIVRRGIVDDAAVDAEMIRLAAVAEMTALDPRILLSARAIAAEALRPYLSGQDLMERNGLDLATA